MPIQGFSHFVQTYEYDCDSLAWKNLCLQFYLAVLYRDKIEQKFKLQKFGSSKL